VEFYNDGKLLSKGTWKDGKQHGPSKGYFEDGSLFITETWIDGVITKRTYVNEDGSIDYIETYKDGVLQGVLQDD
jgi:antitoxin component YwqK of YwqJK toxin-antitoxin module